MLKRIAKLFASLFFYAIERAAKSSLSIYGIRQPSSCVVLYYHVVTKEERRRFARQMEILTRFGVPISTTTQPVIERDVHYVAVTFDDGFRESIENVLPELEKRGIPVSIFVPSGSLGRQPAWLDSRQTKDHGGVIVSRDEMKWLSCKRLVSFGSHCVSHRPLSTLTDEEAKREIVQSKTDLEMILGTNIEELSFPHGAFEKHHIEWARDAGYRHVYSIEPMLSTGPKQFVIGRVRVDPEDWPLEFKLKVAGAYRWLPVLRCWFQKWRTIVS